MFKKNNTYLFFRLVIAFLFGGLIMLSCQKNEAPSIEPEIEVVEEEDEPTPEVEEDDDTPPVTDTFILPEISLANWKVTLPIAENGKAIEVTPPEILEYAKNEQLLPFMYNDSIEGALVFHTYPESTTANSSYSRTELREQMVAGSNSTNWTFAEGGSMKGTLALSAISKDISGNDHRTIIMQIHGRLTDEQRDLIGENDNNAPPVLKIYWQNQKIRVLTKKLVDINTAGNNILYTSAWEDNEGFYFDQEVGFEKFTLEVIASEGRLEVILNETEAVVFDSEDMVKWGVFENYFKAGNYLQTTNEGAFANVKYYDLVVSH